MSQPIEQQPRPSSRRLKAYIAGIVGLAVLSIALLRLQDLYREPLTLLLMMSIAALAGRRPCRIPSIRTTISVSDPFLFATLALLGGLPAVAVGLVAVISSSIGTDMRASSQRLVFNLATSSISVTAAWFAFDALDYGTRSGFQPVLPMFAATTAYFITNITLVAGVISIDRRRSFLTTWADAGPWNAATNYFGMTLALALLFVLERTGPAGLVLGIPSAVVVAGVLRKSPRQAGRAAEEDGSDPREQSAT